jgi:hypothetical protein
VLVVVVVDVDALTCVGNENGFIVSKHSFAYNIFSSASILKIEQNTFDSFSLSLSLAVSTV